jgi:apolipoprotein N-acyltransferase
LNDSVDLPPGPVERDPDAAARRHANRSGIGAMALRWVRRAWPASGSGQFSVGSASWRALLLGVLAAGALPPFTIVPLLLVAIPGLLLVIGRARTWRVAAAAGLAFGMGYHLAGLYWVTNAVLVMAEQFWWAVPITVPLLAAVLGLFIAIPCALARLAPAGWRRVAVLAGAWVLGDLARQFVLSGFPWNLLGSVWEMPGIVGLVFMQPAAWVGVHGLTLATLLLAASPLYGRRGRLASVALLCVWAGGGALRLRTAPPMTGLVAVIVQGNVSEADHRDHGEERAWADRVFDGDLALTRQGMARVGGKRAIVVWPETASPYALAQDRGARLAVADAAAPALMTLAGTERFEGQGVAHNSLVAVAPGGDVAGIYDKSHLVPFGEYFPSYAHLLLGEQGFVPGPGLRTLHLAGLPAIGPLICYEAIFPARVVQPGDRPALLVNITNDAWFGDSAGPRQHLAAARLRTVEEGLPMLRAANTGISAVIDAQGRVLTSLGLNRRGILTFDVPGPLPPTLFARFGLSIPLILSILSLGVGAITKARELTLSTKN